MEHRERDVKVPDFGISNHLMTCLAQSPAEVIPAGVTKFLDRDVMYKDPKALAAIRKEGAALVAEKTWLEDTVIERENLVANAKRLGKKITLAQLMTICSIKFHELDPKYWIQLECQYCLELDPKY